MYCPRCNSYACACMGGMFNQMAAQQQMGMANMPSAQHLAYLHGELGRAVSEQVAKVMNSDKNQKKKLLLLRK